MSLLHALRRLRGAQRPPEPLYPVDRLVYTGDNWWALREFLGAAYGGETVSSGGLMHVVWVLFDPEDRTMFSSSPLLPGDMVLRCEHPRGVRYQVIPRDRSMG